MAARRRASPPSAVEASPPVRVERIGADGDGVAAGPGGKTLFLAGTLPGELVQPGALTRRGDALTGDATILEPSPDRVAPPCPHFGPCGGCTLQHWRDEPYAAWKAARAAASVGLPTLPLARTPPAARRRMDLGIQRYGNTVRIGLHQRRSANIVDMHACPVLHPTLFRMVQALRPVLLRLNGLRRAGEASVNLLDSGPDLLLRTDAPLSAADRIALAALATSEGVSRISAGRLGTAEVEPAAVLRRSTMSFSGQVSQIPPGAFLQASLEGERAIVDAVLQMLPERIKGPIIELYAGSGSLTDALTARGRVMAYEGNAAAIAALRGSGNNRLVATQRDLARQPLGVAELQAAGAVVLDPPFAGAAAQMPALAASSVPVIIYVSCNPGALARDRRVLAGAGYALERAEAVDQFLWSSQVETVALFRTIKPKVRASQARPSRREPRHA